MGGGKGNTAKKRVKKLLTLPKGNQFLTFCELLKFNQHPHMHSPSRITLLREFYNHLQLLLVVGVTSFNRYVRFKKES